MRHPLDRVEAAVAYCARVALEAGAYGQGTSGSSISLPKLPQDQELGGAIGGACGIVPNRCSSELTLFSSGQMARHEDFR